MNKINYCVEAFWDDEADVWVATSNDIPGLATEAPTIELLTDKLRLMIPELVFLNHLVPNNYTGSLSFELVCHRQEIIEVA